MENTKIMKSNFEQMVYNLKVGTTFNRYKDVCNYLGQPSYDGNSRKSQIKDWSRYFDWEKIGQKFIITEVYEEPEEYIDGRLTSRNKQYIQYVEDVLLCYFYVNHKENTTVDFTTKELYQILGMINDKFYEHNKLILYGNEISKFNINDFYKRAKQKLNSILKSALLNMKRRKIISYNEEYKICTNIGNSYELHIASVDEVEKILNIEYRCMHDMGFDNIVKVFLSNRVEEYYNMCKSMANKLYNWNYYYQYYSIIVGGDAIASEIKDKGDCNSAILLNKNIVKYLNNQANDRYDKNVKEQINCICDDDRNKLFVYPPDYVEAQEYLSNTLISIDKDKV